MSSLNYDIKNKLKHLNIFEKIIAVNVVVFIVALILRRLQVSLRWIELPSDFYSFIVKPWTLITYAFLHYDFMHIFFNMLWLYVLGRMFINLFSVKIALNVYFLGALFGGLLFLLGYNVFPNVFTNEARLLGASGAVRALLIFLCAYMPNKEFRFFMVSIKLWYVGAAIVFLDFMGFFGLNPGGNLAHFGGSILGYLYATQLRNGHDIGKGFGRFMDSITRIFTPKSPLKTVYKKKAKDIAGYTKEEFKEFNNQKRINIILDKISKSGYESLSKEEKEFLFKAGK